MLGGWIEGREMREGRAFDVEGWRVVAGLHEGAEEDGDVAGCVVSES